MPKTKYPLECRYPNAGPVAVECGQPVTGVAAEYIHRTAVASRHYV